MYFLKVIVSDRAETNHNYVGALVNSKAKGSGIGGVVVASHFFLIYKKYFLLVRLAS